jgi:menaquinone reductase, multiheme cytochrome c subunit
MTIRGTILFAAGMASALSAGWLAFPRVLYQTRQQPLEFNHKVHTSDKVGSKCADCHSLSADGRFNGIPSVALCGGCHAAPVTDKAAEKKLIDEYVTKNREIPWLVYARQPENVHFSHATHINLAKLACERCHGDQGQTDKLRPYQENRVSGYSRDIWGYSISRISTDRSHPGMKMDDCTQCHAEKGVTAGCMACHK